MCDGLNDAGLFLSLLNPWQCTECLPSSVTGYSIEEFGMHVPETKNMDFQKPGVPPTLPC